MGIILLIIDASLYDGSFREFLKDKDRPLGFSDIAFLLLLPANISVTVRRLHDVNRSGWWWWLLWTMIGALFPLLYWFVQPSTDGDNHYGKKPE